MSIVSDISDGFKESLDEADRIKNKFLNDADQAWANWKPTEPIPIVACDKFDYDKQFAETIINSCYNSFLNGTITVYFPNGSSMVCTWSANTSKQDHIDNIVSNLEDMAPGMGDVFNAVSAGSDFATALSDEIHTMLTSGSLSGVGTLSGSNITLTNSFISAMSLTDDDAIADALGQAVITYCKSLSGVYGAGSGVLFSIV